MGHISFSSDETMFNKALDRNQITGLFEGLENWGRGTPVLSPSLTGSSPISSIVSSEQIASPSFSFSCLVLENRDGVGPLEKLVSWVKRPTDTTVLSL